MHAIMKGCDGEFVGRIQGTMRRDERPRANAGVLGSRLYSGKHREQYESKNCASYSDETNLADADRRVGELEEGRPSPAYETRLD